MAEEEAPAKESTQIRPSLEEFQRLKKSFEAAQRDYGLKTSQLKEVTKRWKQAAKELDEQRSQNQGFYQVTDDYLTGLASQLRFNIKSFAIQYFGEEIVSRRIKYKVTEIWEKHMKTVMLAGSLDDHMMASQTRPSVIQAFLWSFLCEQIFDRFRWAMDSAKSFRELAEVLRPCEYRIPVRQRVLLSNDWPLAWQGQKRDLSLQDAADQRKFQVWAASTTGLFLDCIDTTDPGTISRLTGRPLVEKITETLEPFRTSSDRGFDENLLSIIYDMVMLDRELYRQVSRIEWAFLKAQTAFDPSRMTLEQDVPPSQTDLNVIMTVAPRMCKFGKSTGEDFHIESMLLPMEVLAEQHRSSK
jgi:hypothetical protein